MSKQNVAAELDQIADTIKDMEPVTEQAANPQESVKTPFNPFSVLTVEELTELLDSYPKQWRESNMVALSNAQTEFGISDSEAIFLVALREDAQKRILNKQVTAVAGRIINLMGAVGGTQSVSALDLILSAYNEIPASHRKAAGIKVRDAVKKTMVTAIAEEKLKLVYEKLEVTEKQWMR